MRSWLYLFVCVLSMLTISSASFAQVNLDSCPSNIDQADYDAYLGVDCEDTLGTNDSDASLYFDVNCNSFINPPAVSDWVGDYGFGAVSSCLSSVNGSVPDDMFVCPGAPHDITTCQVACSGTDLTDCQDERDLYLDDLAACLNAPTQDMCNDWQNTYACDLNTCYLVNDAGALDYNPYEAMGAAVCGEFTAADETALGYTAQDGIDIYTDQDCSLISSSGAQDYCYLFQAMEENDCLDTTPTSSMDAPECGDAGIALILDALEVLDDMGFGNVVLTDGVKLTWKGPRFKCKYYYVVDRLTEIVEMMCTAATIGNETMMPNFGPAGFNGGAIMGEIGNINSAVSGQMQSVVLETAVGGATSAAEGDSIKTGAINSLASSVDGMMDNIIDELPVLPTGPDRQKRKKRPCRDSLVSVGAF